MNDNLETLLFLLRLPFILLSQILHLSKPPTPKLSSMIQTREAALERIQTREPTPLPRIMPRTLTFNFEDDLDRSNSNNNDDDGTACCSSIRAAVAESQLSASPFFRLPLEVRRIIYMQVLGGQRLHIVRKHKRLRFLRCRAPSLEECPTPKCQGSVDGEGVWTGGFSGKERTDGGVLDLLLVCWRVYVHSRTVSATAKRLCALAAAPALLAEADAWNRVDWNLTEMPVRPGHKPRPAEPP